MSTKDGCETLGVTLRTLYRYIDTGDLPAYKMCRLIRLRRAEVEQFITNNKVQPGDISAGQAASNDRSWPWTPKAERSLPARMPKQRTRSPASSHRHPCRGRKSSP